MSLHRFIGMVARGRDRIPDHLLPQQFRRKRKELWEFRWQRDEWAELYKDPVIKERAREYWRTFRHLDEICDQIALSSTSRVLDVGCGISTVLDFIPGKRIGIDPLAESYKSIYEYATDLDIRIGYGEAIPFDNDSFDAIFCSNSIDHHEHPERTVMEMHRVLAQGGYLVVTCETFANDLGARNAGHPHSITTEKLLAMMQGLILREHWDSPWYGLRGFALGGDPTSSREQILLLQKR